MEEVFETYAYFWISDFDCAPTEITKEIGLEPTCVVLKGEPLSNGRSRNRSFWEFHSSLPRTEEFQDAHLSNLMVELLPRVQSIKAIGLRYASGINCVGYYKNVNFGFHMNAELMQQCAQLDVDVDFDLYNNCELKESV